MVSLHSLSFIKACHYFINFPLIIVFIVTNSREFLLCFSQLESRFCLNLRGSLVYFYLVQDHRSLCKLRCLKVHWRPLYFITDGFWALTTEIQILKCSFGLISDVHTIKILLCFKSFSIVYSCINKIHIDYLSFLFPFQSVQFSVPPFSNTHVICIKNNSKTLFIANVEPFWWK